MDRIKLSTKNVSIEFPGVKALEDINFEVSTGEIRAVVGANGAGKSTLMKVLSGANPTYTGEVLLNDKDVELRTPVDAKKCGVQIVYQEVDTALFPNLTVAENIIQGDLVMDKGNAILNWGEVYKEGRKALDRLHISKERINEKDLVSKLSLADKQMVLIAKAIRRKCNFLILDEPTNHLDIDSKEVLENALIDFDGTLLFVSHDRYFINRVATHILELSENGSTLYLGDYDYYVEKKAEVEVSQTEETSTSNQTKEASPVNDYQAQKESQKEARKLMRQIENLEAEIETLEIQAQAISEQMLETNDAEKLMGLQAELDKINHRQEEAMLEWEELSEQV